MINGKASGAGKISFKKKQMDFKGYFREGVYHGDDCIFQNGDYMYEGSFKNGKKNGLGKLTEK